MVLFQAFWCNFGQISIYLHTVCCTELNSGGLPQSGHEIDWEESISKMTHFRVKCDVKPKLNQSTQSGQGKIHIIQYHAPVPAPPYLELNPGFSWVLQNRSRGITKSYIFLNQTSSDSEGPKSIDAMLPTRQNPQVDAILS